MTQNLLQSPAAKQWKIIGNKHHHGINVPLFSLHSEKSSGIGEYPDLIPLIDWCKEIGFDTLQTLPLNDTGIKNSPYSIVSSCALNPIYLGLTRLPNMQKNSKLEALTHTPKVDYSQVYTLKMQLLRDYYASNPMHYDRNLIQFQKDNPWLAHHTDFYIFVQYLCFKQLQEVKQHAEKQEIFLKGDLPILVTKESVDVAQSPSLFDTRWETGAPPDMFSKEGQNWGFPLYNWEQMQKQNYAWWKQRLSVASRFYHIYRLDHIVGLFRIWAIPPNTPASQGQFLPETPQEWIEQGKKTLTALLHASDMLPIGEDLGSIPETVRDTLENFGICGTKVLRWENSTSFPSASLTTVSTHDSEPLQLWWQTHPKEAQALALKKGWTYCPNLSKEQHHAILKDSHQTSSLFHINLLQEYLALVPGMTSPNLADERINSPNSPEGDNWTYRFRPSVEDIVTSDPLRQVMRSMIL